MDYETKPISRATLREIASALREIFEVPVDKPFPVLEVLDRISLKLPGTFYEIVEDYELDENVPAQCVLQSDGTYIIFIKNTVYEGAYERKIGGYLNHILHEICHRFMFYFGYTPITRRSFSNKTIPAYCSVEWQAKALCGELMVPHEAARTLSVPEIVNHYHTSYDAAEYQKKVACR